MTGKLQAIVSPFTSHIASFISLVKRASPFPS